jgi:hypothetical protein
MRLLHTLVATTIAMTGAWRFHTSAGTRHLGESRHTFRKLAASQVRGGSDSPDDVKIPVTPHMEEPEIWARKKKALVCMDVFSEFHGFYLAMRAKTAYGAAVVAVFSDYMKGYFEIVKPEQLETRSTMFMPTESQKEDWCRSLKDCELVAISCESDSGLADAERLGVLLGLERHDGVNEARRNKYLMIEEVGKTGIPVVKQKLCRDIEEAREFAREMGLNEERNAYTGDERRVVVKPIRGVASDSVFLCNNMESVDKAFTRILGSKIFGSPWEIHDSVLVQECAVGQEFAIDIVSKGGEHKIAAIWRYDKRPANGAPFVYFSTNIFYDGEMSPIICEYAKRCLDALGIRWGMTHNEVILTEAGPRLVEVNCRQHNMDFLPLTMGSIGYNALDMLLSAYLGGEEPLFYPPETDNQRLEWDLLPEIPSKRMNACMVHLVNYKEGKLVAVNEDALMEIQNMDSVLDLEVYEYFLEVGSEISPTIDIRSDAGWIQMINPDQEEFERDYRRIVELMPLLFEVE